MLIDYRISVPTSPEVTWQLNQDVNLLPLWQPSLLAIEPLSENRTTPGAKTRLSYREMGGKLEAVETLLKREPPALFSANYETRYTRSTLTVTMNAIPTGTDIRIVMDAEFKGAAKSLSFMMRGTFERRLRDNFERFRRLVIEKNTGTTAGVPEKPVG